MKTTRNLVSRTGQVDNDPAHPAKKRYRFARLYKKTSAKMVRRRKRFLSKDWEGRRGLVDGSGRVLPWLGFARPSPPPRISLMTIPDESCFENSSLTNPSERMIQIDLFCLRGPNRGKKLGQRCSQKKLFQEIFVKLLTKPKEDGSLFSQFGKEENEVEVNPAFPSRKKAQPDKVSPV